MRFLHKSIVLSIVLVLFLCITPFTLHAAVLQEKDDSSLLEEIGEQIEKHYLFAPEEGVRLRSLEELQEIWQDSYSTYLYEEQFKLFQDSLGRSLSGIGAYLKKGPAAVTVVSTVPGAPAARAGLQSGDLIVIVDGQVVLDYPLEKVVALLRGEAGTSVEVTVRRGERLFNYYLVREQISLPNMEHVLLDEKLVLLRVYNFDNGVAREVSHFLQELKEGDVQGIILDLRNNYGGYVEEALALASYFTDGTLLQVREKDADWQKLERKGQETVLTTLPLVVMVDGGTASGAEIVAAALKDNGAALLLGERTFGKGTMQTVMPLKHDGYLKMTTAEFASPRRTLIEGMGVEPHFLVTVPLEQEDTAVMLLRYVLQQESNGESYLGLYLQEEGRGRATLPQAQIIEDKHYYPLRAVLSLTGRPIHGEEERGIYSFIWENNLFQLDINKKLLMWPNAKMENNCKVLLQNETTYVPLSFLKDILGIPYFN